MAVDFPAWPALSWRWSALSSLVHGEGSREGPVWKSSKAPVWRGSFMLALALARLDCEHRSALRSQVHRTVSVLDVMRTFNHLFIPSYLSDTEEVLQDMRTWCFVNSDATILQ